MSEEQRREVEKAREQARLSGQKFESVFQATEPRLPQTPRGPSPETKRHREIQVKQLERTGFYDIGSPFRGKPGKPRRREAPRRQPSTHVRRAEHRDRLEGLFIRGRRGRLGGRRPSVEMGSPANITPNEKVSAVGRINKALAKENRKYAFLITHGGTDEKKQRSRLRIIELQNEKRSVLNMEPVPGHVQRAELLE